MATRPIKTRIIKREAFEFTSGFTGKNARTRYKRHTKTSRKEVMSCYTNTGLKKKQTKKQNTSHLLTSDALSFLLLTVCAIQLERGQNRTTPGFPQLSEPFPLDINQATAPMTRTFRSLFRAISVVGVKARPRKLAMGYQNQNWEKHRRPTAVVMLVCPALDSREIVTLRPPVSPRMQTSQCAVNQRVRRQMPLLLNFKVDN